MPEIITADMLDDFGPTIQGAFKMFFPKGIPAEEMKNSPNRLFRGIYEHIKKKEGMQ